MLEKQSVLQLRSHKGDVAQECDVMTEEFQNFGRPKLQKL